MTHKTSFILDIHGQDDAFIGGFHTLDTKLGVESKARQILKSRSDARFVKISRVRPGKLELVGRVER